MLLAIVTFAVWSWSSGGIVALLVDPGISSADRVEALRTSLLGFGSLAPLVYVVAVTIEVVVAPFPGLILYAPGGVIFGGFMGGLLSLIGNVVGAGIAFWISRVLGGEAAARLMGDGDLATLEHRLADNGTWVVFLLRVNPLTSSDLVSYAAGLTSMPATRLMIGTTLGMAPLCFIQAYAAASLFERWPWLVYPLLVLAIGYLAAALWLLAAIRRRSRARSAAQ